MIKESAPEFSVSGSDVEDEREEPKIDGENDPDFSQVCLKIRLLVCMTIYLCLMPPSLNQSEGGAKRQKLNETGSFSVAPVTAASKSGIRRSTRHRKLRGEKALIVSANQTLKELKIQVFYCCDS